MTENREKKGLFARLREGMTKTRESITHAIDQLTGVYKELDDDFYDDLEAVLIGADIGVKTTEEIITRLKKKGEDSYDYSGTGIAMAMIIMMLVYVSLTHFLPLYVTTPIFLICSMYYLGMRKWKVLLPIAVGMDIFIYLVFGLVFKVPIPMGILFG